MGSRLIAGTIARARHVLVVDDDFSTRETLRHALCSCACTVSVADTPRVALELARLQTPNLALIDLCLANATGLDVARALARERIRVPWILMSAHLDYDAAVQAGRLGALRAVASGFDVEQLVAEAFRLVEIGRHWPLPRIKPRLPEPGTSAEYLAWLILWACDAPRDLRTIAEWGVHVAASRSSLADACYAVGVRPQSARDFMRVLCALTKSDGHVVDVPTWLRVADSSTRSRLLAAAGLTQLSHNARLLPDDYFNRQTFVAESSHLIDALRSFLAMV
jgi:CheY-like chemotaxis protein